MDEATEKETKADRFQADRVHLTGVAFRLLGSLSEADDAVQEAWFRFDRTDTSDVANVTGWLTTVVSRVCLDMLRSRRSRPELLVDDAGSSVGGVDVDAADPQGEAQLADSVGLALLVVLETLAPAERLAFVLHDLFALPFDEIAPLVGRTPAATRQLASRARRRVQGPATATATALDRHRQREVVEAFLRASRGGDLAGLVALLDPEVELRVDPAVLPAGVSAVARGAEAVSGRARTYGGRAQFSSLALIDGHVGLLVAPHGRLLLAQTFRLGGDGRITAIEIVGDPERLAALELAVIE